jgi:DNA modification methylase
MLRNYGVTGQIGLEETVDQWVEALRAVMTEVARVLKPTGSLWLNLGDSYSRHPHYGAPPKGLLCSPERVLLALTADGWIARNKVIFAKSNPMPASVTDRLNTTYEVVYFLVRSQHYWFDLDAIREAHKTRGARAASAPLGKAPSWAGPLAGSQDGLRRARAAGQPGHPLGKNPGDVWRIATRGFRGAHFATFPTELVYRPLLATCPKAVCTRCGAAWRQRATVSPDACGCEAPTTPGIVLDPFFGSGTVAVAAGELGRDWIGIELNPEYAELAMRRIELARQHREEVMNKKAERTSA